MSTIRELLSEIDAGRVAIWECVPPYCELRGNGEVYDLMTSYSSNHFDHETLTRDQLEEWMDDEYDEWELRVQL